MTAITRVAWLAGLVLFTLSPCAQGRAADTKVGPITACVFSADGTSLIAAQSEAILVLSTRDGTVERREKPDGQRVTSIALSPDGTLLAVAGGVPGESGRVLLVDWKSGRVITSEASFRDITTSVSFSPDGKTLAAASADATAGIFSIDSTPQRLQPTRRLEGHAGPVLSVVFGSEGKVVVTASADRSIKVWDTRGGTLKRTLTNHAAAVNCLASRPPPRGVGADESPPFACASGADDHTVRVWQPDIGRMVRIIRGHEGPIFSVCYAPDGSRLYSAGSEGIVRVIGADSDRIEMHWSASPEWIYTLSVSPDGKQLATGDWAGNVRLWRIGMHTVQLDASYPLTKAN